MTLVATFTARGLPRPQGSKRAFIANGRAVMTESNKAGHKDWRATVAQAALDAMGEQRPVDGPLAVTMTFALPRPKSHPKTRTTWPVARPDIDKLVRAVADSCTHTIWRDDSQVVQLVTTKCWAGIDVEWGPGVLVTVESLVQTEAVA